MADTPEQARRRQLRDEYKKGRRDQRRALLPLDEDQLDDLLDSVDECIETDGCDHTLRHSEGWAGRNAIDWEPLRAGLCSLGGHCDCEVVMNVEPEELFG